MEQKKLKRKRKNNEKNDILPGGRLTTDNPTNNTQTMLNYAYAKDGRVFLRYGNGKEDIDLCEYVAETATENYCKHTPEEIMDGACMECDCPFAILYTVATQAAELREKLKEYEDKTQSEVKKQKTKEGKKMREILFRGKRADNEEWIEGLLVKQLDLDGTDELCIQTWKRDIDGVRSKVVSVIPSTVGQYTGSTDKNGKKIFEGDIVKNEYGYIGLIVMKACSYYIEWQSGNFSNDLYVFADSLEVIGDIHDNQELLNTEGE